MAKGPTAAVAAAARTHAQPHDNRDKLLEITATAEIARGIEQKIAQLKDELALENSKLFALYYDKLPSLMVEARMENFTLSAKGNSPAVEYKMTPVYRASISSEWPEAKQQKAFAVLKKLKAEALVRAKVVAQLPKGKLDVAYKLAAAALKLGVQVTISESVHHGTLSAWLKELYVEKKKTLPASDLEAIGGFVGRVVKPKEREAE